MDPPHRPPFFWKNGLHFFKKMNPPQHPPFFQKNNGRSRPYFHCHRPLHVEQIFLEKKWALWGRFCSKGVGRLPPSVSLGGGVGAWAPALPAANLPGCKLRCLWGWPPAGSLLAAPVRRAQPLVAAGCANVPVGRAQCRQPKRRAGAAAGARQGAGPRVGCATLCIAACGVGLGRVVAVHRGGSAGRALVFREVACLLANGWCLPPVQKIAKMP